MNGNDEPIGVVSSSDLLEDLDPASPVGDLMSSRIYTVGTYDGPHVAARVMRNHRIHHVLVTHEKKVVGIVSAFDLLRLVEEHRYVAKRPPTPAHRLPHRQ